MRVLCRSEQLAEGEAIGIQHGNEPVERGYVLVRRAGRVYAYKNRCPHTGVNLEWLPNQFFDSSGHYLQCSVHGAIFDVENGQCLRGPCAGDALAAVTVEERSGEIVLTGEC
jgi:nitrite reductase/ring-hydroxylating ferredoxin subunit